MCYVDVPRFDCLSFPSKAEQKRIFNLTCGQHATKFKKTAIQHIKKLKLLSTKHDADGNMKPLSKLTFKQIMYNHGFEKRSCCWKPEVTDQHQELRVTFARVYLTWD